MDKDFDCVILSACRTAIGAFGGSLKDMPAVDLAAIAIREAVSRAGVAPADIGDVIMGCVLQAGEGMNVARQAGIKAGMPVEVPGETVNRVCGSGLQSVVHAVEAIRVGYVDAIVAGGTESMSNAPYLMKGARWGYRTGNAEAIDSMIEEGLRCAIGDCHMGMTAEEVAARYKVSREDQDQFAADSQAKAARALADGSFRNEIVTVDVPQRKGPTLQFAVDEYPRATTTVERLAALTPAFRKDGTVTAGNASGINDGAAALVIATRAKAQTLGVRPLARILSYVSTGVDPMVMGIGPIPAVRKVLDRAKLSIGDVDLFELNEAFAAQSVAVVRELGIDPAKVNVNGGAIALGHPIGASGARILTTLLYALRARKLRYGVASLCIGGGMGIAMAVEAL
ncbi:MAG TPA: acetyl-CoA C-acetyltransferase [Vicinamibacterales bacterium]|nr:acetyl-CoA C-acetyltransferase [Vicinamibacterales bacterium]